MIQKQTKILFVVLLGIDILSIVIFILLYSYMNNQITQTIQNTDEIKMEIKKQEALSVMKTDIQNAKVYQTALTTYFVAKGGDVDFIKVVEAIAATSSVKLQVNSVSDQSSGQTASVKAQLIRVTLNAVGDWKQIQYFSQLLEMYPLKITINQVTLNKFSTYQVNGKNIPEWSGTFDIQAVELK